MENFGNKTISVESRKARSNKSAKLPKMKPAPRRHFKFDKQIFTEDIDYRFDTLVQRFREMAFVTRGVTIYFVDERAQREDEVLL